MIQSLGILFILGGAILFHIAASNINPSNINEVWRDILATMQGKTPASSNSGSVSA
jgi:hypothetical protein